MLNFITQYKNPNAERFNKDIIETMRNESLLKYILNICKSRENQYITMIGWEFIEDESKFDTTLVNKKYSKKNIKGEERVKNIYKSRYSKLIVHYAVEFNEEAGWVDMELLLPKRYKKYYYLINGNKLYPIYQLVNNSTYSTKHCVILKSSIQPLLVKRKMVKNSTTEGLEITSPMYVLNIFGKKDICPLCFYMATMGYEEMLDYFSMRDIVYLETEDNGDPMFYCFQVNKNLFIKTRKFFFNRDIFTQAFTFMLKYLFNNRTTMETIQDTDIWKEKLGSHFTTSNKLYMKRGTDVLISFGGFLNEATKETLHVDYYNKCDTFATVRWVMRHFGPLKLKDNIDLANKRLRMGEYMASYFGTKMTKNNFNIMNHTKLTLKRIMQSLKVRPTVLIDCLVKSPLLRFDNTVNDNDLFNALRYTADGPSSMGQNSQNSIPIEYKNIHPSQVGKCDLNTSSSSNPGLSGILTPFVQTKGFYFEDVKEPQNWPSDFEKLKENYEKYLKGEPFENVILNNVTEEGAEVIDILDDISEEISKKKESTKITIFDMDSSLEDSTLYSTELDNDDLITIGILDSEDEEDDI